MLKIRLVLIFVIKLVYSSQQYRMNGKIIIGAILPMSENDSNCEKPNLEGIAHAEAIVYAITLLNANTSNTIGYDIRDSCNNAIIERKHCSDMSEEAINYKKNNSKPIPISAVISRFSKDSLDNLKYFTEPLPILQISYSPKNARLNIPDSEIDQRMSMLLSAFPDKTNRMISVAAIVKEFGWQYVHVAVSDDLQGNKGYEVLKEVLFKVKTCTSKFFLSDKTSMKNIVETVKKNTLVKVLVIHATEVSELLFYKMLNDEGLHHLTIITTTDWSTELNKLKSYPNVVEGMIYISANFIQKFKDYIGTLNREESYNKPWLKNLFLPECFSNPLSKSHFCNDNEATVLKKLKDESHKTIHSLNSVFTVASLENKLRDDRTSINEAIANLSVRVKILDYEDRLYMLYFTDRLTATEKEFIIYNVQLNKPDEFVVMKIGSWTSQSKLKIEKYNIEWKNDTQSIPKSICSENCSPGLMRIVVSKKQKFELENCCWTCVVCPNLYISNITNAKECIPCKKGEVSNPSKTICKRYILRNLNWSSGGIGSLVVFLIFIGCVFVSFAVVIFTVKYNHEIVKLCDYKLLLWYLIGCLIILFSSVPLINKPTVSGCSTYLGFFNFGITIVFSALFSRSEYINQKYKTMNNNLDRFFFLQSIFSPRVVTIFVLVLIQFLILLIGLNIYPIKIIPNETEIWDVMWVGCSSSLSYVWWASFSFNIALSITGNLISCWSSNMKKNGGELKHIAKTYCVFYLLCLVEIIIIYSKINKQLEESLAVMSFVFSFSLLLTFIGPKLFIIYFKTGKDGKSIYTELRKDSNRKPRGTIFTRGITDHEVVDLQIKS
ncbi:metabotropic glutamate receptor isoform X2 [Hydra vulgaris]|uniref:Metabotropic glutamate receptor isoform X2 n=1 Tax=Hydra vulgaris TaxID=6087 RepID=A0ABM4CCL0_HYDVU